MEFVSEKEILKAQEKVAQVDFSMQVNKMIEYNKLDKDYVMACMQQYKNFLVLQMVYKDVDFVPNGMIDEAWHQHILDTAKYREDCNMLFGRFLEHYPYFGLRGKEDENRWNKASDSSERVYEHHFKTKLYDKVSAMSCERHGGPSSCWSNSNPKNGMPQGCKAQSCRGNSQSA
ncbi:glycine-rich domain-containing protein [Helicobacter pylori]